MVRTVHSVVTFRAKLEHSPVGQRLVNIAIYLARLTLLSSNRVSLGCCNTRIRTDVTLGQRAVSQLDITGYSTNSRCFYISSLKGWKKKIPPCAALTSASGLLHKFRKTLAIMCFNRCDGR